jgi:hypothetical protein
MRIKIRGGTARSSEASLCVTCRYATIVRGARLRDEIVQCSRLSDGRNRITFPVTSCNGYVDRTHPTIGEMEETAWILRSDPRRNQVGFVKASRLKPAERYVLSDDDW